MENNLLGANSGIKSENGDHLGANAGRKIRIEENRFSKLLDGLVGDEMVINYPKVNTILLTCTIIFVLSLKNCIFR